MRFITFYMTRRRKTYEISWISNIVHNWISLNKNLQWAIHLNHRAKHWLTFVSYTNFDLSSSYFDFLNLSFCWVSVCPISFIKGSYFPFLSFVMMLEIYNRNLDNLIKTRGQPTFEHYRLVLEIRVCLQMDIFHE